MKKAPAKIDKPKNKGGRPLKYSIQEVIDIIAAYFQNCNDNKRYPTKAGLCVALDVDKETYNEWKKNKVKGFSVALKRFERVAEDWWVQRLTSQGAVGAIFYLKNAFKEDYKDKFENENTGAPVIIQFDSQIKGKK